MAQTQRARTYDERTQKDQAWRDQVATAFDRAGYYMEAYDFALCGNPDTFFSYCVCESDPAHFAKPIAHTCKLRVCPECAWRETGRLMKRYLPQIRHAIRHGKREYRLRHIVLTTGFDLHTPDAQEKYREAWRAVPKTFDRLLGATWHTKGQGYIASSEFGERGNKLHFHILFYGRYIEKTELTKVWEDLTKFKITFVRLVTNPKKAANEVLKYCTKLTEVLPVDVPLLHEVIKGSRRVRSRGVFYNLPDEEERAKSCPECGQRLALWGKGKYELWHMQQIEEADRQLLDDEQPLLQEQLDLILGNKSPPTLPGFEEISPHAVYF